MAAEDPKVNADLNFVLDCLAQNSQVLTIDFHAAANKVGMTLARNTQQKFKKLIESTGKYALVNGKVVDLEEDPNAAPPTTPAKRGRGGKTAGGTPRTAGGRKRKTPKDKDDSDENESEAEGTPLKKRATTKRTAAKAAAEKVKEETSDDGDKADGNGDTGDKKADEDANANKEDSGDDDLGEYKDPKLGGAGRVDNSDDI